MAGFTCPHCGHIIAISNDSRKVYNIGFHMNYSYITENDVYFAITAYECPNCKKQSFYARGHKAYLDGVKVNMYPTSSAKQYPEYVPAGVRADYEEAYAIALLSPKASATLSRRCLQGIIRDFWEVKGKNLQEEINKIQDKISPDLWRVLDGVRRIGNIGAHMEKDINLIVDIEPNEAEKLIKLIELLIDDTYIRRYEQNRLFDDIVQIDEEKQEARKG